MFSFCCFLFSPILQQRSGPVYTQVVPDDMVESFASPE